MASTTPTATPTARFPVHTVTTTVTTITAVSGSGIRRRVAGATLCQLTVLSATTIITAASATIGIRAITPLSPVTTASRKSPATTVETRVRARPIFTLTTVWPIMAQPAIPPQNPAAMLATPSAQDSRPLAERVSVRSSTSFAVSRLSSNPTKATLRAVGQTICSVSRVSGTVNGVSPGSEPVSGPSSPTSGTVSPASTAIRVTTTMATRGAGTAVVSRGSSTTMAMVRANSG